MTQATFRITVNGFHVEAETWDDALELDGKRDEVFITVRAQRFRRDGAPTGPGTQLVTPVMGDVNGLPGRVRAGSASDLGGLRTGDSFPTDEPHRRTTPLAVERVVPPFEAWTGTLQEGGDAVTIQPAIWEWDPGQNTFQGWLSAITATNDKLGDRVRAVVKDLAPGKEAFYDAGSIVLDGIVQITESILGMSKSRPIGTTRAADGTFQYEQPALVFTYESAKVAAATSQLGVAGLLPMSFQDDPYLRGHYLLYLQIEDVSGGPHWLPLAGYANDITAGPTGEVWVLGGTRVPNGWGMQRWDGRGWQPVGLLGAAHVALDVSGVAWTIDESGRIFRLSGWSAWPPVPPALLPGAARHIAAGRNGAVWVIGTNAVPGGYGIYRWDEPHQNWANIAGGAVRVAVAADGTPWVVNDIGVIFRGDGTGAWGVMPGRAREIAIGGADVVWCIGTNPVPGGYGIYRWNGTGWDPVPGGAVRIAVDRTGAAWVVNDGGTIFRRE